VNQLQKFWLKIRQGFTPIYLLPRTIANFSKQRRRQIILNEREVERLDRIRNPEKYRGK